MAENGLPPDRKGDARIGDRAPVDEGEEAGLLGELYRKYWSDLCRHVRTNFGHGPPEPEDVAQLAFAQIAARGNVASIENPRAFLWRTARNIVLDDLRARTIRQNRTTEVAEIFSGGSGFDISPERVLIAKEDIATIAKVLNTMPVKRREALLMHRVDGLSLAEIARRTGRSPTAIKKHIVRAMADIDIALMKD